MKNLATLRERLPSLAGRAFAITGTTSGTGFVAAQAVAEQGAKVLLLNRPSERATASLERLRTAVPDGDFIPVECDLMDFNSVKAAAATVCDTVEDLYGCVCNAGVMALKNTATEDGYDVQMQTNHLSHFLLTRELWPLLLKGAERHGEARVVTHSSIARNRVPRLEEQYLGESGPHLGDDEVHMPSMKGGRMTRYQHSKLANSVFTQTLSRKIASSDSHTVKKIRSVSAHPGASLTGLGDHLMTGWAGRYVMQPIVRMFGNDPEDATCGLLTAMAAPEAQNGVLYGPKGDAYAGPAVAAVSNPHETDPEVGDMLWRTSEAATGVSFDI